MISFINNLVLQLIILKGIFMSELQFQKTGTTTLAVKCKDGIIIGADKRTTAGYEVVGRDSVKVHELNEYIYTTTAGNVADFQKIVKVIRSEIRILELKYKRPAQVREVASLITSIVFQQVRTPSAFIPITGFIVGGYDSEGPHIFDVGPDGTIREMSTFATSGSGGSYATSVLEDSFKEGMSLSEAIALVKRAFNVALLKDMASGNGCRIYSITKEGSKLEADITVNTGIEK